MHTAEFYVSRDEIAAISQCCNIHEVGSTEPIVSPDSGEYEEYAASITEADFEKMFGFVLGAGKSRKVRITVEEIPKPPPMPRLCWFEIHGERWSGFRSASAFRVINSANVYSDFTDEYLRQRDIVIHWYDEEPANCE